jgi:hemolysin III
MGNDMAEQSRHEELFNSALHAGGALASVAGLVILLQGVADPWRLFSFSLFSASMVVLYSSSALYHALTGPTKQIIKKIDHLCIYLLIASTYAPFTLVMLRDLRGWSVFAAVWFLAIIGIIYDLLPRVSIHRGIPVTLYLLMGWMALLLAGPLQEKLSAQGFLLLLAGGCCYTFGLLFYALDERVRYFHALWHLCVLAGSLFHFLVVYLYIARV